jgi:hypothetical protein
MITRSVEFFENSFLKEFLKINYENKCQNMLFFMLKTFDNNVYKGMI